MNETDLERSLKERCMRYEARIERLIEANAHLMIGICACAIPHEGERKVLQECVDTARALLSTEHGQSDIVDAWISVKDRLPDDNTNVIVDGGIAYISQGEWWTVTGERFPGKPIQWIVTRWQPVPVQTRQKQK